MYFNFIISDGTGNPSPPVSSSRAGKGKHSQYWITLPINLSIMFVMNKRDMHFFWLSLPEHEVIHLCTTFSC